MESPVAAAGDQDDMVSPLPGGVTLDYMVAEAKPWTAWYEFGNTGTRPRATSGNEWGSTHHS